MRCWLTDWDSSLSRQTPGFLSSEMKVRKYLLYIVLCWYMYDKITCSCLFLYNVCPMVLTNLMAKIWIYVRPTVKRMHSFRTSSWRAHLTIIGKPLLIILHIYSSNSQLSPFCRWSWRLLRRHHWVSVENKVLKISQSSKRGHRSGWNVSQS